MRKAASAFISSVLLGFSLSCGFGSADNRNLTPAVEGPPSPDLMQYAEDITRSWNARATTRSWRSEIDDVRASGPVHIESEAVCPDRYSVSVSGSEISQEILIDGTRYQRNGHAAWKRTSPAMTRDGIPFCQNLPTQPVNGARIRLVAEQLRNINLSKPVIRDIAGHKCREWTRTFPNGKTPFIDINCFDVKSFELVQSRIGNTVTTYYWNIPVEIKPPM